MSGRLPLEMTTSFEFFVFNATFGTREGEEEKKILYYYPQKTSLDSKLKQIGFCEATIAFLSKFSRKPAKSVKTSQSITVFLEGEPNFWLVLSATKRQFAVPENATPISGPNSGRAPVNNQAASAASGVNREKEVYEEDELQSSVYEAFLGQLYNMFRFFTGGLQHILVKHGLPALKERLFKIFSRYFTSLKFDGAADPLSVFPAIRYQPIDRSRFLKVACFINEFEHAFEERYSVRYTMVYHGNRMVWSNLPTPSDNQIASYYLVSNLFSAYFESELYGSVTQRQTDERKLSDKNPASNKSHFGKFVTGLQQFGATQTADHFTRSPKVFIRLPASSNTTPAKEYDECYLVVYAALRVFLCVFVSAEAASCSSVNSAKQLSQELDEFLGKRLSALSTELSEYELAEKNSTGTGERPAETSNRNSQTEASNLMQNYRFVYFNSVNLSIRSTLTNQPNNSDSMPLIASRPAGLSGSSSARFAGSNGQEVSIDVIRSLIDLRADLFRPVPCCAAFSSSFQLQDYSSSSSQEAQDANDAELCYSEILAQTANSENMIVCEKSDQRELHVVGLARNANLVESKQDVKRLVDTQLPNIFFLNS